MRLAVLTPSLTGQVHLEHAESMGDLRVECIRRGVNMKRFFNKGCSVLPKNRNVLTAAALAFDPEWILWVDPDVRLRHFEGMVEHSLTLAEVMNALEAADGC